MSSAIIESFEYMVIYENREDRSAATSMKPQKKTSLSTQQLNETFDLQEVCSFHKAVDAMLRERSFSEIDERYDAFQDVLRDSF